MKRLLLIVAAALLSGSSAMAQSGFTPRQGYGAPWPLAGAAERTRAPGVALDRQPVLRARPRAASDLRTE